MVLGGVLLIVIKGYKYRDGFGWRLLGGYTRKGIVLFLMYGRWLIVYGTHV